MRVRTAWWYSLSWRRHIFRILIVSSIGARYLLVPERLLLFVVVVFIILPGSTLLLIIPLSRSSTWLQKTRIIMGLILMLQRRYYRQYIWLGNILKLSAD